MAEAPHSPLPADSPLVSVVIATYADASLPHLELAVNSIQSQTYQNLEILIVLDGPVRSDTQAYLDRVTLHDDRVQIVTRFRNEGPAIARNFAIERACGDYIAILDADDIAVPERIEKQLAYLKEHNADLVGSFYRLIDGKGTVIGKRQVPVTAESIRKSFCMFNPIANSTVFAKAAVLKTHPYPEPHRFAEDYELWIKLARRGLTLLNQDEYLVLFRTDDQFIARRTGLPFFRRELQCKLKAVRLQPFYLFPFLIVGVVGIAAARLLPASAYQRLYRIRGALRFGAN